LIQATLYPVVGRFFQAVLLSRIRGAAMSLFGKVVAYVGNNSIQIDAGQGEQKLRQECPRLLQTDETVVMAFKDRGGAGRDDSFFTTQRVLIRDVRGMTGKAVRHTSIPYHSILAWSVDTPGAMDPDCTLRLWSHGVGRTSIDFVAGQVDIFNIMRHFNWMCLVEGSTGAHVPEGAQATMPQPTPPDKLDKFLGYLGGDACQLDKAQVERELKQDLRLLMEDETVELAFKAGRDSFVMTSKRVLKIDVQGFTGKKVEYLSVLWSQIKMFSVETAGFFDTDAELLLFTDIPGMTRIRQDLRRGKADVLAIQKYFADKLLGMDNTPFSAHAVPMAGVPDYGSDSILAWLGNDSRMIDAQQVNQQYHTNPPILQGSELVEMAFKGRRDLMLFTTKRLLFVDLKAFSGRKVNYVSVPWRTVQCFGVRSAGAWLDKDSEMFIWTNVNDVYWPPKSGDDPPPPPIPRMSFLEIDFQKDRVDLMAIHRYLSERCLRVQAGGYLPPDVPVSPQVMAASPPGSVERFLNWIGDDARLIPAGELELQLRSVNPMIQADEGVGMAYRVGRDMIIFTTKRVIHMDVQGLSGTRIEWKSIPYESLRAFSVQSAGAFDRDAEVRLFTKTYWINGKPGSVFAQDLRKGRCDIMAMQSYLAAQVFGRQDGSVTLPPPLQAAPPEPPKGAEMVLNWIGNDAHEVPADEVDASLHSTVPILQTDEKVEKAYKVGRDMAVFTTKRIVFIDKKAFSGKKIEYMSYPLRYCTAFEVQSAGMITLFLSAHARIYTDIPGASRMEQDFSKGRADIWDVHTQMAKKLL